LTTTSHDPAAALDAAVGRLVNQVSHWTAGRWAAPASGDPGTSRAALVFALVQALADLGAAVENHEPRPVSRLVNDLGLPDQVRVMVADLLLAGAPAGTLMTAVTAIDTTRAAL
jgi:hypothetical protein